MAIIIACVMSYVLFPGFKRVKKIVKNKYVAATIIIIFVILITTIPAVLILNSLVQEGTVVYILAKQKINDFSEMDCNPEEGDNCRIYNLLKSGRADEYIKTGITSIGKSVSSLAYNILITIPSRLLDLLIILFLMFSIFVDWKNIFIFIRKTLPMKIEHEKYILTTLKGTIEGVVFGQAVVAIVLGILGGLIFLLFGIPNPVFWGAIMAFLALIPIIGTTIVWIPASLLMIFNGINSVDNTLIIKGGGLFVTCMIFLSGFDTFVKPKIIGDRAKLHPALILLGVIGGLSVFGPIGFILGPLILAVFITLVRIYEKEKEHKLNGNKKVIKKKKRIRGKKR